MLTAADTAFGTREEAVAMVKKGVAYIEKVGSAEAFAEMTKTNGMFIDRDLYLFALDFNGVSLANGQNAKLVGNNLSDMKDINGFPFVKEMIALMKKTNAGWVVYQWNNKKTGKIDPKASYVVRVGTNALIGCGVLDVAKKK
ncbi:MAG: cache domain-containing protein [Spirochaetes bacterium]|nr:cache domain-containing protein [Spirochaetota bacterium]